MSTFFSCKGCGHTKPANIRLKGNQEYCGDPKCQRARKAAWQKKKMAEDPSYKAKQTACVNRWRQNRPLHQYQRAYREDHPEYVKANREKQRIRNARRSERQESTLSKKIVKMDALRNQPIESTAYLMTPYEMDASGKIVKMDTLFVELLPLQADSRQISGTSP